MHVLKLTRSTPRLWLMLGRALQDAAVDLLEHAALAGAAETHRDVAPKHSEVMVGGCGGM